MSPALRLCVLSSDDAGTGEIVTDPRWVAPELDWGFVFLEKATADARIAELAEEGWDVFVNLCDGSADEERPGIEVVEALERRGLAFTGAGSAFYEPSRDDMKRACASAGVPAPRHMTAQTPDDAERAADFLGFPVIVKHPSSYGSVGITRASRCTDLAQLREQIARNLASFGAALVEEYVAGRELTVLVAEPGPGEDAPRTWAPIEFRFPPGESFRHFELKWVTCGEAPTVPVDDAALADEVRRHAAALFTAIGGSGYGRCDVRVGPDGVPRFLEINANCGIFYPPGEFHSADTILDRSPGGHRAFLDHIVQSALARQRRSLDPSRVPASSRWVPSAFSPVRPSR